MCDSTHDSRKGRQQVTKQEKRQFINELVSSVRDSVLAKVNEMPEAWDGIELRQYLADKFVETNYRPMDRRRKAVYNNTIAITTL